MIPYLVNKVNVLMQDDSRTSSPHHMNDQYVSQDACEDKHSKQDGI